MADWGVDVRLTVLGGCGAWPAAGQACSGYLVEHDGFRLLLDPGYATLPLLLGLVDAGQVDAVWVSHGHPDHCADLNPLLRARALRDPPAAPLPVYAPPGALDAVLALDRPGMLTEAYQLIDFPIGDGFAAGGDFAAGHGFAAGHSFAAGDGFAIGPFLAQARMLPHWVPDAGLRLSAGGTTLAYPGDSGPCPAVVELAGGADLLLAEATHVDMVPADSVGLLSSATDAGRQATAAGVGRLLLTHLWPGTDPAASVAAARTHYRGPVDVATGGLSLDLG